MIFGQNGKGLTDTHNLAGFNDDLSDHACMGGFQFRIPQGILSLLIACRSRLHLAARLTLCQLKALQGLFADKLTPHKLLLALELIGGNCQGRFCTLQIRRGSLRRCYKVSCIEFEQ